MKKNRIYFFGKVFLAGFSLVVAFWPHLGLGSDNEDVSKENNQTNTQSEQSNDLNFLEEKAAKYRKLIDLKQKQKATLNNQLQLINIQADNFQNDIEITKENINEKTNQVRVVEGKIDQQEKNLLADKSKLSEIVKLYYQIDNEVFLNSLMLSEGSFHKASDQAEYLSQTSEKIKENLEEIEAQKKILEGEKREHKKHRDELEAKKHDLNEKIFYLNNEKVTKNILLNKTLGEERKYQELLSRVEAQKKELIGGRDSFSAESSGRIKDILKNSPKPKKLASEKWYYAQDDSRWAYKRIGLSSSLLKDYGCAISAVAMVFSYHGKKITPGELSSEPIFYRDLIVWPQKWKKSIELKTSQSHGNINWSRIDRELAQKNPVIVFIRSASGAGHYVVIHSKEKGGKYVVHDPLFGKNIYLETSKRLVGAIYNTAVEVDQMIIYKKK